MTSMTTQAKIASNPAEDPTRRRIADEATVAGVALNLSDPSDDPSSDAWSSKELNLLFHGLCVHSRLRPDLIAEGIKTRSVVEVCAYIRALHDATEQMGAAAIPRKDMDIAKSVSHRWIQREEALAQTAIALVEDKEPKKLSSRLRSEELRVLDTIIRVGETNTEKDKFSVKEELPGSSPTQQTGPQAYPEIPRDVSPLTRIRMQKRLHMRRKRARERGEEASMELAPLPLGRRKKTSNLPVPQTDSTPGDKFDAKLRKRLMSHGLTADKLQADGLGLFRLAKLGKLMKICGVVYGDMDESSSSTSISLSTLRYIHAHLLQFLTEIIHRAVVVREQELRMKDSKIFRVPMTSQIQAGHVRFALNAMGVRHVAIKDSFAKMGHILQHREGEISGETLAKNEDFPTPNTRREPPLDTFSPSWLPWLPSVAPETMEFDDDEALLLEVEEEEDLDAMDQEVEQDYEMLLWKEASHVE